MNRERLPAVLGLVAFAVALWCLHGLLREVRYQDIVTAMRGLSRRQLLLAGVGTLAGYLTLTGYDTLGGRYVGRALAYWQTALAAFIGFAFSQTVGLGLLSGGMVRYRLYSAWGLSATDVGGIIGFVAVSFWVGFCALGGMVFLLDPPRVPAALHLPVASVRPVGVVLCALVVAYVVIAATRRAPLVVRGQEVPVPPRWMLLPQIVIGALDWCCAGTVLWVLLPAKAAVPLPVFLGSFLLAQGAGLVSHVPGGLGVFEAAMVMLLGTHAPAHGILGALVAFRVIYYFVPLAGAAVALGVRELLVRPAVWQRAARGVSVWSSVLPSLLAGMVFFVGVVLLFSSATPAVHWRLAWITRWLPLGVLETSHFAGSLVGVGLLLLARDLQRRLDSAYVATIGLLGVGIVASLLKGLDYEEALLAAVTLVALIPTRRQFYRRGALLHERLTPLWAAAVVVAVVAAVWLGVFAHRHVGYAHELWWQFELEASAPRAMRATTGAAIVALFAAVRLLRRPAAVDATLPSAEELARVPTVLAHVESTTGNLALVADKTLLWNDDRSGFVMYAVEGKSWIALGDPVAAVADRAELAWAFHEMVDRHEGYTVFYQVEAANLPVYIDLGLTFSKLGEEARVPLANFSLSGGSRKSLRQTVRRLADDGLSFRIMPVEEVATQMDTLRAVSDAWLGEKSTREKGFSLGRFDPAYLRHFPMACIERGGSVLAFANVWCGGGKQELSIDLMRHLPDAPNGTMDFLFASLMQWGREQGYGFFNLGMAPLSGLPDHALAPLWNRIGGFAFHHGEHFYNFQGLRSYKEKFGPVWEPRYLASPGGIALPRVLTNLATLISGGARGVLGK